ncbi:MAG: hypothetical protein E7111_03155 [Bacteroidales bacterium]|nr:hypothetical protein [Bacteroidales bacterium]
MKLIETMKILALSAAVVAACQKPEMEDKSSLNSNTDPEAQYATVTFAATAPGTKVSIGDKENGKYPGLWEAGDAVKVVYSDGSEAGSATVEAGEAGNNIWGFTLENVQVGVQARVVYPATAGFGTAVTLPSAQTQTAGGSSIGKYSYALSEEITTTADEPVKFTLNYFNSIIKINLKSTQYAAYDLKSVGFFSRGAALAGEFTVADGALVAGETTQDRVIVTLSEPASLESEQTVWMTAFPADLTDKEVYVVATLEKDDKELVVPVEFAGAPLLANKVNSLDVELSSEKAVQWYVGDDPRNMLGYYAYGAANTVTVSKTLGAEDYTTTFEVKARGDFYQVSEPVKWDILTKSERNSGLIKCGSSAVYSETPRGTVSETYTVNPKIVSGNYYDSTGNWGVVAIYDKDNNLIWSFMIFSYYNDDPIEDVDCGTYGKFMDRALGQKLSASALAKTDVNYSMSYNSGEIKPHFTQVAYFQWGRKDPFMMDGKSVRDAGFPYQPVTSRMSVEESVAAPYKIVTVSDNDWCTVSNEDFWGGVSNTKTAFDPCPAGYRVPKPDLLRQIDNYNGNPNPRTLDLSHDVIPLNYVNNPKASGDKWIFTGFLYCQNENNTWVNITSKGTSSITVDNVVQNGQQPGYLYWANTQSNATKGNGLYYTYNSGWTSLFGGKNVFKTRGAAVRCVKE